MNKLSVEGKNVMAKPNGTSPGEVYDIKSEEGGAEKGQVLASKCEENKGDSSNKLEKPNGVDLVYDKAEKDIVLNITPEQEAMLLDGDDDLDVNVDEAQEALLLGDVFLDYGDDDDEIINQSSSSQKTDTSVELSLDFLRAKREQLYNSIMSRMSSQGSKDSDSVIDNSSQQSQRSVTSEKSDTDDSFSIEKPGCSSTPLKGMTPASRVLKTWNPLAFSPETIAEEGDNADRTLVDKNQFLDDKAASSAKGNVQNQNETGDLVTDYHSKIDAYSNKVSTYNEKEDRELQRMLSFINEDGDVPSSNDEDTLVIADHDTFLEMLDNLVETGVWDTKKFEINEEKGSVAAAVENKKGVSDQQVISKEQLFDVAIFDELLEPFPPEKIANQKTDGKIPVSTEEIRKKDVKEQDTDFQKIAAMKDSTIHIEEADNLSLATSDDLEGVDQIDEDVLLASDDEKDDAIKVDTAKSKPIDKIQLDAKPPLKDLPVFISENQDENDDNADPKWDYLKNLGSDYERFKAVRERWRNVEIPNPKKDLTVFNFRVSTPQDVNNELDKHSSNDLNASEEANQPPKKRRRSSSGDRSSEGETFRDEFDQQHHKELCTVLFDHYMRQVDEDLKREIDGLQNANKSKLQYLADCQQMEKQMVQLAGAGIETFDRLERKHRLEVSAVMSDYQRLRTSATNDANRKLSVFKEMSDELKQLYEFYPDEDIVYLDRDEVAETMEVENVMNKYAEFYV